MLQRIAFLSLLLLPFPSAALPGQPKPPPRLVGAEMPSYPPIAEAAHITGWLEVRLTVERGKVVNTEVIRAEARDNHSQIWKAGSQLLIFPTLVYLKTWRFDSDIDRSFVVRFTYKISGSETESPTTPMIEILPTLDVTVTARPVKPTVNY